MFRFYGIGKQVASYYLNELRHLTKGNFTEEISIFEFGNY